MTKIYFMCHVGLISEIFSDCCRHFNTMEEDGISLMMLIAFKNYIKVNNLQTSLWRVDTELLFSRKNSTHEKNNFSVKEQTNLHSAQFYCSGRNLKVDTSKPQHMKSKQSRIHLRRVRKHSFVVFCSLGKKKKIPI